MTDQTPMLSPDDGSAILVGGQVIYNVHKPQACWNETGPCCIHRPSQHSMSNFPQFYRSDRGFMERICPHGIGHPDPDDLSSRRARGLDTYGVSIHGCDGCCRQPVTVDAVSE